MKKLISLLLVITMLISVLSLSMFTTYAEDEVEGSITDVESAYADIERIFIELYGEEGFLDDNVEYYWDYNYVDDASTDDNNLNIMPRWSINETSDPTERVTHDDIIDAANEIAKENGIDWIPTRYLPLVKYMSKKCDQTRNGSGYLKENNSATLHGKNNYLAALDYLWAFARNINSYEKGDDITEALNKANDVALSKLTDEVKNRGTFKKLSNFTMRIVKKYYNDTTVCFDDNQTEGKRCKYIVYGLICHMLGDIYAHSTIVPKATAQTLKGELTYDSTDSAIVKKYFNPSDFSDFKTGKLNNMISIISTGPTQNVGGDGSVTETSVAFFEISDYLVLKEKFTDGLTQTEAEALLDEYCEVIRLNYTDNGKFRPTRVTNATKSIAYFLENFTNYKNEKATNVIIQDTFKLKEYSINASELVD